MSATSSEPRIIEFGPYRVIGLGRVVKGGADCPAVWDGEGGFIARMDEVQPGADFLVGICRCVPGATDGSFEYIAARPAKPGAPVPKDMVEVPIPAGAFAVFSVAGIANLGPAWGQAHARLAALPGWQTYCNEDGCDCANHPAFELYPPDFTMEGEMFLYFPVRRNERAAEP